MIGCPEDDVRLVGSELDNKGRLEFCQGGVWRVICQGGMDPVSATVACRQLGHDPIGGKYRSDVYHSASESYFSLVF